MNWAEKALKAAEEAEAARIGAVWRKDALREKIDEATITVKGRFGVAPDPDVVLDERLAKDRSYQGFVSDNRWYLSQATTFALIAQLYGQKLGECK